MSEYDFYAGLDGAGAEPVGDPDPVAADAPSAGAEFTTLFDPDAGYGDIGYDASHDDASHDDASHDDYGDAELGEDSFDDVEPLEPVAADGTGDGLLDGFDLDFTAFDGDLAFDASYDLIGSDPDENGWWDVLTSDHNHDGAYDTVSYGVETNPYVVH